jgi:hypothetical protein
MDTVAMALGKEELFAPDVPSPPVFLHGVFLSSGFGK